MFSMKKLLTNVMAFALLCNTTSIIAQNTFPPTGNVGIGTINPMTKLDVFGFSRISAITPKLELFYTTSGDVLANIRAENETGTGGKFVIQTKRNGHTLLDRMTIDMIGNVGIGTTNPTQKLDVNGNIQIAPIKNIIFKYNGTDDYAGRFGWSTIQLGNNGQNKIVAGKTSSNGWLDFYVNNKSTIQDHVSPTDGILAMRISANGNVGIGTETPDSKLSVNGKIHAKEVKVDLTGWPDYVFALDYKLPTLKEVEKHIKTKGHLKNIPSAKEVAKNGVLLGEMNKKLLQKIEELTLYAIQQEKNNKKLLSVVQKLEKRIKKLEK
jgi:hypothetical protein